MRWLILVLILTGCGGDFGVSVRTVCRIDCLGRFQAEGVVSCQEVTDNFEVLTALLTTDWSDPQTRTWPFEAGVEYEFADDHEDHVPAEKLMSARDYCDSLSHLTVTVYPEEWQNPCGDPEARGCYDLFRGVSLNQSTKSLAHEVLHHWETIHFRDSSDHQGWKTLGYGAIDRAYRFFSATEPQRR